MPNRLLITTRARGAALATKLLNIGFIAPTSFFPPTNGGERVCYDLFHALEKIAHVTCYSTVLEKKPEGIDYESTFKRSKFKYVNVRLIGVLRKSFRDREIHFCILNQPFLFMIVYLAAKISKAQVILYAHNLEFRRRDGMRKYLRGLIFLLELMAFRSADKIFFISLVELQDACRLFRIPPEKCLFVPHIATQARADVINTVWRSQAFSIVFFGDFSYGPNSAALDALFRSIVPRLNQLTELQWELVIFGKSIPVGLNDKSCGPNIDLKVLGFIEDPTKQLAQSDVMLSLAREGAGVQTKIIEALATNLTVVSTRSAARGIESTHLEQKLLLVEDEDWDAVVETLVRIRADGSARHPTPPAFFETYSEKAILEKINGFLCE